MIDLGLCPHCGWHLTMANPATIDSQPLHSDKTLPESAKALKTHSEPKPLTKAERTEKARQYARDYAAKRRAAKASKSA